MAIVNYKNGGCGWSLLANINCIQVYFECIYLYSKYTCSSSVALFKNRTQKTQKWWLRFLVFWSSSLAFELKCKVQDGSSGIYIDFWNKLLRDGNKEPYLLEKNVLLAKVAPLE